MADFAPPGCADAARLANGEWREVVMQQEVFLVAALKRIHPLLILAGA
jgi:hypothetical protein